MFFNKNNHNKNAGDPGRNRFLLAIGSRNLLLQAQGVKKQQKAQNSSSSKPALSVSSKPASSSSSSSNPMGALELMAMTNVLHNASFSAEQKQPLFESFNSKLQEKMSGEQSKTASLASNLNSTKSKLADVKQALSSGDLSADEQQIYQLISAALSAQVQAFEQLLDKSKYAQASLSQLASYGVNQVVGESDKSSDLLEMLAESNSEYTAQASAKLIHMSSESQKATKKLGRLIKTGKLDLMKASKIAKDQDPEKTAQGLDSLYRSENLAKEDRLTVTSVLTDIAMNNPQNGAGKAAAGGLENIFKKDSGAVSRNAAIGLRMAAISGNGHATEGLINVAKSPVAGKEKNKEAIKQLTIVAKTGNNQSQRATDALTKMANSPSFSGDLKEQLVESLGQIAYNGGQNGNKALDNLANIASDSRNPSHKTAFNQITKLQSHKIYSNSNVVKAFSSLAENNRTDTKTQKRATARLGEAAKAGNSEAVGKAEDSLVRVMTNPANKASGEAKSQLQQIGFGNMSKMNQNVINHQLQQSTQNSGIAHFMKKSKENPFAQAQMASENPFVKAINF